MPQLCRHLHARANGYDRQSLLSRETHESGKLLSCVYRFGLHEKDVQVSNILADKHIIATFVTQNPKVQYGADGIAFDKNGNLFVGNFGDGEVFKITFDEDGNLYVADFNKNAIARITPDGKVTRIAQSPDCDGLHGELDQPGEPRIWNGVLIASCFDLVTDDTKVNTAHEMPATLSMLEI